MRFRSGHGQSMQLTLVKILVGAIIAGCPIVALSDAQLPSSRPFHLGFTPWPADLTLEGLKTSYDFAMAHGDILSIMFIGGIPWQEALEGRPFSEDVERKLGTKLPPGKKLFLSISPLDQLRSGLAPYWGEKDNLPLPREWFGRPINSPEVKRAYRAFVLRCVDAMKPDFLAIGIELNVLMSKNPVAWRQVKELYRETYTAVKSKHPALPVCFTTEVNHYKKLATEARGTDQEGEVGDLMRQSDLFAMSIYPHMSYGVPRPVPKDFLDFARKFEKPIAVSESGMTSRDIELKTFKLTLRGSEEDQRQFTELVLSTAARDRYRFVITFATTDFEKLCDKLPSETAEYRAHLVLHRPSNERKEAKTSIGNMGRLVESAIFACETAGSCRGLAASASANHPFACLLNLMDNRLLWTENQVQPAQESRLQRMDFDTGASLFGSDALLDESTSLGIARRSALSSRAAFCRGGLLDESTSLGIACGSALSRRAVSCRSALLDKPSRLGIACGSGLRGCIRLLEEPSSLRVSQGHLALRLGGCLSRGLRRRRLGASLRDYSGCEG